MGTRSPGQTRSLARSPERPRSTATSSEAGSSFSSLRRWGGTEEITPESGPDAVCTVTQDDAYSLRSTPPTWLTRRKPSSSIWVTRKPTSSMWAAVISFLGAPAFCTAITFPSGVRRQSAAGLSSSSIFFAMPPSSPDTPVQADNSSSSWRISSMVRMKRLLPVLSLVGQDGLCVKFM